MVKKIKVCFLTLCILFLFSGCQDAKSYLEDKYDIKVILCDVGTGELMPVYNKYISTYFVTNDDYSTPVCVTMDNGEFSDDYVSKHMTDFIIEDVNDKVSISTFCSGYVSGNFLNYEKAFSEPKEQCRDYGDSCYLTIAISDSDFDLDCVDVFKSLVDELSSDWGIDVEAEVYAVEDLGAFKRDIGKYHNFTQADIPSHGSDGCFKVSSLSAYDSSDLFNGSYAPKE